MKKRKLTRSSYWLDRVSPDGDKHYVTVCFNCRKSEERVLSRYRSTGFHFTYPMRCPSCGLYSKRYQSRPIETQEASVAPEG